MHNEHHDLIHEFPEHKERIHELKVSDSHFRRLFDEYHELDREIRRAETDIEPRSDFDIEKLKKKRLSLKDDLYEMIKE